MTNAVISIHDGFAFQARYFWLKATALLDPGKAVIRVGFESGPKSFDDVWVEYAPGRGPLDPRGNPIRRIHHQCKWHVSPGIYGHAALTDPDFINASAKSFLARAHGALLSSASATGGPLAFSLVTNWRTDPKDRLGGLISKSTAALRLERLFAGGNRSEMGKLRRAWLDHLGVDEDGLRLLAEVLRFEEISDSLVVMRDRLDDALAKVGLRRIPQHETALIHDAIAFNWLAQGRNEFDRDTFRETCRKEGLDGDGDGRRPMIYGIKSFNHRIDALEDRCDDVLDLTPSFHDRQIADDAAWTVELLPRINKFLVAAAKGEARLRLALDAHLSLAFAAGAILDIKSGRAIELIQRTASGYRIWSADDVNESAVWPTFVSSSVTTAGSGPEMAVAIGLTHNITGDVSKYVESAVPSVGRILTLNSSAGAGQQSIICGRHAAMLADAAVAAVRKQAADSGCRRVHLFVSSPASFAFYLGQRSAALGPLTLYEFDFEGSSDGSYRPSMSLPSKP
jgi:hypothetical protein